MVMCNDPVMRTPFSGRPGAYFLRMAIKPGISCSATDISLRPQSAKLKSATLYSVARLLMIAVLIESPVWFNIRISLRGLVRRWFRGWFYRGFLAGVFEQEVQGLFA